MFKFWYYPTCFVFLVVEFELFAVLGFFVVLTELNPSLDIEFVPPAPGYLHIRIYDLEELKPSIKDVSYGLMIPTPG